MQISFAGPSLVTNSNHNDIGLKEGSVRTKLVVTPSIVISVFGHQFLIPGLEIEIFNKCKKFYGHYRNLRCKV